MLKRLLSAAKIANFWGSGDGRAVYYGFCLPVTLWPGCSLSGRGGSSDSDTAVLYNLKG